MKEVMHLQRVVIRPDRTHHSQSMFSAADKTLILVSLGEKQCSLEVRQRQHLSSLNLHHIYV